MTGVRQDTMALVKKALDAFIEYWEESATEVEHDAVSDPITGRPELRNSNTAMEMLFNYIEERRSTLSARDFKLLAIEKPFAVPLDPDRPELIYIGRLDKVFEYQGRVYIGEHKTTTSYKKDGPFRSDFVDSFSPNSQVDGYLYAAHLIYGKKTKACWIDAALVHASVHDGFRFLPVERRLEQLTAWVWETKHWIEQVEANHEALSTYRAQAKKGLELPYLPAFAKNTKSCTDFGGCRYLDLCKMWANPESRNPPPEFRLEKWEPFDELELAKVKGEIAGAQRKVTKKDILFDNTRVQDFRVCPRFHYFRHVRTFVPDSDRRALLFGGGWHRAMDVVWKELCRT